MFHMAYSYYSITENAYKVINIPSRRKSKLKKIKQNSQVFNLPKVREPLDELGRVVLIELNIREVHFQHSRRGIANPEEHQFGFTQVHWG